MNRRIQAERRAALRVIVVQALVALVAAAVGMALGGRQAAVSALAGGGIGLVGTSFMAVAVFRHSEAAGAGRIVWGFYLGQFLKVLLTMALLVIAFRSKALVPLAVLAGYVATFAAYWFAPRGPMALRR